MEYPIKLRNKNNRALFGVIHQPDLQPARKIGIVFLCAGLKHRVGPHRLYVKMARWLCERGYYCFRVDPEGLGDSEGEIENGRVVDLWRTIQNGRFVADARAAVDAFHERTAVDKLILTGLCGGAITALLTAAADKRVDALIFLGMPIYFDGTAKNDTPEVSQELAKVYLRAYLQKIFKVEFLKRLLLLRTDYRLLFQTLKSAASVRLKPKVFRPVEEFSWGEGADFNYLFLEAYVKMVEAGHEMLFLFGENDILVGPFRTKFKDGFLEANPRYKAGCDIHLVKNANHQLSLPEWQGDGFAIVLQWLENRYGKLYGSSSI
ncbi:MAG: serine aminopeptidase domain-containing protein [bacterium]